MSVQIVRRTAGEWEITRVRAWKGETETTHEYETIGRIVRDGDLFYPEAAEWKDDGLAYRRLPRGYLLLKGAFAALTRPPAPKE